MEKDELIAKQKELIYQLSKLSNTLGREWRERVEKYESEIAALEKAIEQPDLLTDSETRANLTSNPK
jgi:hypothetical protein